MDDTQFVDSLWEKGDAYFIEKAGELYQLADTMLASLETQALALRDWFREERTRMQQEARGRAKSHNGQTPESEQAVGYAPLNIFVKTRKGGLEIFWQEVHVHSKRSAARRYVYLPRGKTFRYTDHKLRKSAKPFELELVLATERRAAQLREYWSIWMNIQRARRNIMKIADASKSVHQPVTSSFDAGIPQLVPGKPLA